MTQTATEISEARKDFITGLYQDMSIKELRQLASERTPDVKSRSKQGYIEALAAWHIAQEEQSQSDEQVEEQAVEEKPVAQSKQVKVLAVYKFNKISRICFSVRSSDGTDKYQTCFDKDAEHGSCTCKGGSQWGHCYHQDQLKPVAQAYFAERQAHMEAEIARASTFLAFKFQYDVREQGLPPSPAIVTVGEAITSAVEGVEAVIEEEAVAGDRTFIEAATAIVHMVEQAYADAIIGDAYEQEVLYSEVCQHPVKRDVHRHCGCLA